MLTRIMAKSRLVKKVVLGKEQSEGMGATVRRCLGSTKLRSLDPFLMLDEFKVKHPAGFPDHPHRGFETVTYIISGAVEHEDFAGHSGVIRSGDLQWMTAGKGIVHSEMPHGADEAYGLQLWVNLKKSEKLVEPLYQELLDGDIPKTTKDGVTVKVIAGESLELKSKVRTRTPAYYLDFKLEPNSKHQQQFPNSWTVFAYTLAGTVRFGPSAEQKEVEPHHVVVFAEGEMVEVENVGQSSAHFVLIGGQPIGEPVVQYGPFAMTSQEEIQQAFKDYREGKNGFENAPHWKSKSGTAVLEKR